MGTVRKEPLRTWIGCRQSRTKKELIRVVRTPEGELVLDATGRKNGRGAYLCRNTECLQKAKKNRGLSRSLNTEIPEEIYDELEKELRNFE